MPILFLFTNNDKNISPEILPWLLRSSNVLSKLFLHLYDPNSTWDQLHPYWSTIGKDTDAGKDLGQEEKEITEDEMFG